MRTTSYTVLMVTEPSVHQTSLRSMLESAGVLEVVGVAHGCLSAMRMVQEHAPDFVLIAAGLPEDEVVIFLESVKDIAPQTRVIVLRTIAWRRPQLLDAGATAVLSQDNSVTDLLSAFLTAKP